MKEPEERIEFDPTAENEPIDFELSPNNSITLDRIVVEKLFNLFDYDISFKNDENISILIAPNGCGKTTILNFINSMVGLGNTSFNKIKDIPFKKFECYFSNGLKISLFENKEKVDIAPEYNRSYKIEYGNEIVSQNLYALYLEYNKYYQEKRGKNFDSHMIDERSNLNLFLSIRIISTLQKMAKPYCPTANYIEANRLKLEGMVLDKNRDQRLRSILYRYQYSIIHNFRTTRNQQEAKMLEQKIKLFKKIYDDRNRITKKHIEFSKEYGFQIFQNGKEVPPEFLSSGEKNDFYIFFNLIFPRKNSSITLIDEPEISLHIDWQKDFLDYVLEICEMNKSQVIIATHSPDIINGHIDLYADKKVRLYEE